MYFSTICVGRSARSLVIPAGPLTGTSEWRWLTINPLSHDVLKTTTPPPLRLR